MKSTPYFVIPSAVFALLSGSLLAQQDISTDLETIRAQYSLPGLTAMVIKDNKIVAQGQTGVREQGYSNPLLVSDPINIGSCTKSMTAAIAGRLVDRGLITWTTRIRDLFSEYQSFNAEFADVTLEQLLQHRGGVEAGGTWEGAHWTALQQQTGSIQQIRRWVVDTALEDAPAGNVGDYVYSNQGFTTAGVMLEIASGLTWETLIQQEVFDPLGMTSSTLGCTYNGTVPPPGPVGHTLASTTSTPVPFPPYAASFIPQYQAENGPAGFVISPMHDWVRFLSVYLGQAKGYLQPATLAKMEAPVGTEEYALGIFSLNQQPWASPGPAFNHEGELFCETSIFWLSPSKDFGVVAYTNCTNNPEDLSTDIPSTALNAVSLLAIEKFVKPAANGPLFDASDAFQFTASTATATPSDKTVTATVTRPWPGSAAATVGYGISEVTSGGSPDFGGPSSGELSFKAGQVSATVSIPIAARAQVEGSRVFKVQLQSPSGNNTLGSTTALNVTVNDNPVVIATAASPTFGGSVDGGGSVAPNAGVTLTASPIAGFSFVDWTIDGVSVSTSTSYHFNATENEEVTANFELTSHAVYSTPVVSGSAAPGAGTVSGPPAGTVVSVFDSPAIDDGGNLAAKATLKNGRASLGAIYQVTSGGVSSLTAFQGGAAPDLSPALFTSFYDPLLAPDGAIAFMAHVSGSGVRHGVDDLGVWTNAFGGLHLVLRTGHAVAGLSSGLLVKSILGISLVNGELAALVQLAPAAALVTASNNVALLRVTGLSTASIALRTGDSLGGSTVKSISTLIPSPTSPGQGRWHTASHLTAVAALANHTSAIVQIATNGDQTVRSATSATTKAFGLPDGAAGMLAVEATLKEVGGIATTPHGPAVLIGFDPSSLAILAGGSASNSDFTAISDPVANAEGDIAFLGTLETTTSGKAQKSSGLFYSTGGAPPTLSAGPGQPAPDQYEHTDPTLVWKSISSFVLPDGANAGPAFIAKLSGKGVTGADSTGLWAMTSTGKWLMLLRTGSSVTIGSTTKQITSFSLFNAYAGSLGARRSYNANGMLAVMVKFSDGTQAILSLTIP